MLAGQNILEPEERIERSSVAYHATALPLSYTGWSRRADSNRRLSVTKALFFPLNYFDLERVTGFEPVSGPWRGPILAARRYPRGASGENRTLLASLEGWNSTNEPHPLEIHLLTFNCQRTHCGGSAWTVRSLQPSCAFTRSFGRQTHWSGTPDSNRESHDPKSCGLSRFPSARKQQRGRSFDRPRDETTEYYLIRG
jgi:hypothetical protein